MEDGVEHRRGSSLKCPDGAFAPSLRVNGSNASRNENGREIKRKEEARTRERGEEGEERAFRREGGMEGGRILLIMKVGKRGKRR